VHENGKLPQRRNMANMSAGNEVFTHTFPNLLPVLEELKSREPIFHRLESSSSAADLEKLIAPDYWEASASGRRYSRDFILRELEKNAPVDATSAGWQSYDHAVKHLGSETYLITYTLRQIDRITRRATIWRRTSDGWCILYHQGTIVSIEEDDTHPSPPLSE